MPITKSEKLINAYSMKTYILLHFEHKNDVTIIVKLFVWNYKPPAKFNNRELKQTDAPAAYLQIPIQKDARPSEFSRPLTSITLNLNGDLPVDRRQGVSLLKLPNDCDVQHVTEHRFSWNKCFIIYRTNAAQHGEACRNSSRVVKLKCLCCSIYEFSLRNPKKF